MMKNYYKIIDSIAYKFDIKRRISKANGRLKNKPSVKLTPIEKEQFNCYWKGWSTWSHEFYKAYCGRFDINYVPNDYYDYAEHVLNLRWSSFFLQHKCNLKYIIPLKNRPLTILQKIDGHYVNEENTELSLVKAKEVLINKDLFVYKVALGSGGGRSVEKICLSKVQNVDEVFNRILKPKDLIFQDIIIQNEFMSEFNPSSVNTLRLLTLNINGNCTLLSSFIRMGGKGSFVDNLCSGGGVLVGINEKGQLKDFGIRKDYSKTYTSPAGLLFKGLIVPDWDIIKSTIINFHKHIPQANLIGWDVTINNDGTPIIIEINLDHAEIEAHQIFNGPVFGDRLEEVRYYINERSSLLRHSMITY